MSNKPYYTKRLGRAVAEDFRTVRKGTYHVIFGFQNNWQVVREGTQRPTRVFSTQAQALQYARQLVTGKDGEIVVHTPTGDVSRVIKAA